MNNQDIHIGIVGAGNIGSTIYQLLTSIGNEYKVSIADLVERKWDISENHYVRLQDTETSQFDEFVSDKTLIINALPFHQNINLYKACQKSNVAYFDLSEDDALDEYIADHLTNEESIPFTMPHCGLAPGMSSIVAFHLLKKMENPHKLKIRVGALSQNASNKLRYYTPQGGDGLVNEYIGDCQVVRNGKNITVDALTGYERLVIDGQEYEAFNTSGGIGTLAKTIEVTWNPFETVPAIHADYKTLNRVGHHDYVDFLFNDLQLDQDTLTAIFKSCIPQTRKDVVIIYVSVGGIDTADDYIYYKEFKPTEINGRFFTAIEYTTAIGLLSMVELYLKKKLPQTGYVRQEEADWEDALKTMYGSYYRKEQR